VIIVPVALGIALAPFAGRALGTGPSPAHAGARGALVVISRLQVAREQNQAGAPAAVALNQPMRSAGGAPLRVPRLTGSDLRVPSSYFSPATVFPQYDSVEDNATADARQFGTHAHSTAYENLGRITGYYELANWGATATATFVYQGSIMVSAASATAAQQDNVTYQQAAPRNASVSSCKTSGNPPQHIPGCSFIVTKTSDKQFLLTDYAWAVDSCLIETEAQYAASFNQTATEGQIQSILGSITGEAGSLAQQVCGSSGAGPTPTDTPLPVATSTPTAPPTPRKSATPTATVHAAATVTATSPPAQGTGTSVILLAVRVEKSGAKADLSRVPLLVVKAGQKVLLSIYAEVEAGTAGAPLSFAFTARKGNTRVLSKSVHAAVPGSLPADIRETVAAKLTSPGGYSFTGIITVGGVSRKKSVAFTVAGLAKKQCVTIGGTKYCS
jgi:hypothetical protein